MKLMVYGTLQQGWWNNQLLAGATLVGQAVTKKPYVLFNCGFPKAVPFSLNPDTHPLLPIVGEVYEVDDHHVLRCDRLEGHPNWYVREKITAVIGDEEHDVEIYEMPEWQDNRLCTVVSYDNSMYYKWAG